VSEYFCVCACVESGHSAPSPRAHHWLLTNWVLGIVQDGQDGIVDAGGEADGDTGEETGVVVGPDADAGADEGDEDGIHSPGHAHASHEADLDDASLDRCMETGAHETGAQQDDAHHAEADDSMGDAYTAPGSESGDALGISGDGMATYVGVGT